MRAIEKQRHFLPGDVVLTPRGYTARVMRYTSEGLVDLRYEDARNRGEGVILAQQLLRPWALH